MRGSDTQFLSSSVQSLSRVQLLRPHGLRARLPCPSPTPGVCSNSCPSSQWCHPAISSSVISFSCLQSCPASGSFPMLVFTSGGQSIGVSALSISPSNEYSGLISFMIGWFDLLAVQGTPKSLLQHHSSKASILWHLTFFILQLSHPYMTTGKTIALTKWSFVGNVMSLLFNMLSGLVIAFLPRIKHLLIIMAVVIICSDFGAQENKVSHCFHCFPLYLPWSDGTGCHDLRFLNVEF